MQFAVLLCFEKNSGLSDMAEAPLCFHIKDLSIEE